MSVPGGSFLLGGLPFQVTLSQQFVTASGGTTGAVSCLPNGGTFPFTYAWTKTFGAGDLAANTPATQSTTFTGSAPQQSGKFICTVHDGAGLVAISPTLTVIVQTGL